MINLREYQQECHDEVVKWIKGNTEPCLIDAAPAAGKSHIIAALADAIHAMSKGKKVLCLAPSAELVKQNAAKFKLTGEPYSIFSASAGRKDLRNKVVFGTPGTVKNRISRFKDGYAAVIIDEAHGITPTIRDIIEQMKEGNPYLRVIGLSGTPYRLGEGYVYRIEENDRVLTDEYAKNPYFMKCVKRVSAHLMLEQGYITPMDIGPTDGQAYDTSGLVLGKNGKFTDDSLHQTFDGQGRLTSQIVANVVAFARHQYGGCMLFASTVQHAHEIMRACRLKILAL